MARRDPPTLSELTPWLFSRVTGGVRWGLERTERLLAGVGDPHRLFRSVLIGGTNGKGSVAAMCDAVLRSRNAEKVGLYTSPHLIAFNERIRIQGRPVPEDDLVRAAERLRPAIEASGATFFEATTAMAFLLMAEAGVEVLVAEVGLGGRLDATNVLQPMAAAITNVALDHQEYLGNSLREIAFEKAGILKSGMPAVTGVSEPDLLAVLAARAHEVGSDLKSFDELATVENVDTDGSGVRFTYRSRYWGTKQAQVGLPGRHQSRNAALAAELLALLPEDLRPEWRDVEAGFGSVRWPGRLQSVHAHGSRWLFDVAHNPAGVQALAVALDELQIGRPRVAVVAVLRDKDWKTMLGTLGDTVDGIVVTVAPSSPSDRRWHPREVAEWCAANCAVPTVVEEDLQAALETAAGSARGGTVVVTGSVHTVGDALSTLGIRIY